MIRGLAHRAIPTCVSEAARCELHTRLNDVLGLGQKRRQASAHGPLTKLMPIIIASFVPFGLGGAADSVGGTAVVAREGAADRCR